MGVLVFVLFDIKNCSIEHLIFAIIFIGGFVFHLFWEAKCQYTITYFVLLIPYAAKGYKIAQEKMFFIISNYKKIKSFRPNKKFYVYLSFMAFSVAALGLNCFYLNDKIYFSQENSQNYEEYISLYENKLPRGKYSIISKIGDEYAISTDNTGVFADNIENAAEFGILYDGSAYVIRDIESQKKLDVNGGIAQAGNFVQLWEENESSAQNFDIKQTDDGYYYIIWNNDYFLTLDENTGNIIIDTIRESDNQKWKFE